MCVLAFVRSGIKGNIHSTTGIFLISPLLIQSQKCFAFQQSGLPDIGPYWILSLATSSCWFVLLMSFPLKGHFPCHDFRRSWFLSLFGRRSASPVFKPSSIHFSFSICLVFPHTWFQLHNDILCISRSVPPMSLSGTVYCKCVCTYFWCATGFAPIVLIFLFTVILFIKLCRCKTVLLSCAWLPCRQYAPLTSPWRCHSIMSLLHWSQI